MHGKGFFVKCILMLTLFFVMSATYGCGGGGGDTSNFVDPNIPINSNTFTLTFNSNGGSNISPQQIEANSTAQMPQAPTRNGYIFVGWYTDNNTFNNMFLFGEDGDKITQDITLYAQWLEDNPELYRVEYALSEVVIGYIGGDNSKHVTRNLTLPTSINDVIITWTSNKPGVISTTGSVNRPHGNDENVTLTATASNGNETRSREFNLRVIHANNRVREDIHNNTISDIENMNISNDELYIGYNNDRTQVANIEGKYSEIKIENADDALDAINGVRSVLGLSNPYDELESSVSTSDSYGGEYSFRQIYDGVRVYGRSVMASANADGEADFLSSSLLASDVLDRANMSITLTQEQAEEAALRFCKEYDSKGNFTAYHDGVEQVIYSIASFDKNPVYAYIVRVSGIDSQDRDLDENIIINAQNGDIINSTSNIHANSITVEGYNELRQRVSFPVEYDNETNSFILHDQEFDIFVISDSDFKQAMKEQSQTIPVMKYQDVVRSDGVYDGHAVSAYTNMIDIMRWWKNDFHRNSLDNNNMSVLVITHSKALDLDNAAWTSKYIEFLDGYIKCIQIGDTSVLSHTFLGVAHTYAAASDVLAHETTHAVLEYSISNDLPYENITGAINEGYADIFGCIKDKNWQIGENSYEGSSLFSCLRNIADTEDSKAFSKGPDNINSSRYVDTIKFFRWSSIWEKIASDHGGVHTNSFIISHAAYLMHEDATPGGLSWQTLGQIWYRSMRLGNYGATTEFKDVRNAVVRAARKLNISAEQLAIIKNAFDQVGIEGVSGTLSGTITDHDSYYPVQYATVNAFLNSNTSFSAGREITGSDGKYSLSIEYSRNKYLINITARNYVEFFAMHTVEESEDTKMDVALVRPGTGSGSLTVRSAVDDSPLSGVVLNLRRGWNIRPENSSPVRTGDITDSNGQFTFENLNAGYYTLEMTSTDYAPSYVNITIAPGSNPTQTGYLSPTLSGTEYRVVLSWGANPSDLDSHLSGRHPNGSYAHVFYASKSGSVNDKSIYLDIDDTTSYGPETITFEADLESSYEYYIVWFSGYGTWKNSEAVINVYNGNRHVAVYPVPEVDNSSGVWSVFRITRGILTPINEIVSSYPEP